MAKLTREQAVRERRVRKQEKRDEKKQAAAALNAKAETASPAPAVDETPGEERAPSREQT